MSNATTNRAVIVTERTTADGFSVNVYSDGAIVGAGAVVLAPRLPARCLWQAVQSICSWDRAELPALVSHARKLAARKGEPEAGDFIRGVAMTPAPAPKTRVVYEHCDRDHILNCRKIYCRTCRQGGSSRRVRVSA